MSVGKSVTNRAMLVYRLPGENAFEHNAKSSSHRRRINRWRNISPLAVVGRMRAAGWQLSWVRYATGNFGRLAWSQSSQDGTEKETENRQTHTRFEFTIPVSKWPIIIRTSRCATESMNSSVWAARPTQTHHTWQTAKRTTDTVSCYTVHLHDKWWNWGKSFIRIPRVFPSTGTLSLVFSWNTVNIITRYVFIKMRKNNPAVFGH
jgi:hypothetical protein